MPESSAASQSLHVLVPECHLRAGSSVPWGLRQVRGNLPQADHEANTPRAQALAALRPAVQALPVHDLPLASGQALVHVQVEASALVLVALALRAQVAHRLRARLRVRNVPHPGDVAVAASSIQRPKKAR